MNFPKRWTSKICKVFCCFYVSFHYAAVRYQIENAIENRLLFFFLTKSIAFFFTSKHSNVNKPIKKIQKLKIGRWLSVFLLFSYQFKYRKKIKRWSGNFHRCCRHINSMRLAWEICVCVCVCIIKWKTCCCRMTIICIVNMLPSVLFFFSSVFFKLMTQIVPLPMRSKRCCMSALQFLKHLSPDSRTRTFILICIWFTDPFLSSNSIAHSRNPNDFSHRMCNSVFLFCLCFVQLLLFFTIDIDSLHFYYYYFFVASCCCCNWSLCYFLITYRNNKHFNTNCNYALLWFRKEQK